jgi:tRNA-binding protein
VRDHASRRFRLLVLRNLDATARLLTERRHEALRDVHHGYARRNCILSSLMNDLMGRAWKGDGMITYADFEKVAIRVGRVIAVEDFPEARKPAYKLRIDFGAEIGVRSSSAQATALYNKDALLNRLVLAVVNFPPKQIGPFMSEVLTLGVPDGQGGVVLAVPEREVPLGGRLF